MNSDEKRCYIAKLCDEADCRKCPYFETGWCEQYNEWEIPEKDLDDIITALTKCNGYDVVNHPSHYTQGGIECIDAMIAAFGKEAVRNFCICNAFKYIWRSKHKNGKEDLDKANWYINKYNELKDGV